MNRRRIVGRGGLLTLLAIAVLFGGLMWLLVAGIPTASLLNKATRITGTRDWQPSGGFLKNSYPYAWRSDHELLHLLPAVNGGPGWRVAGLDVRTGARRDVAVLPAGASPYLQLSPDQRWLLGRDNLTRPPSARLFAVAVDGSRRVVSWPYRRWMNPASWLADSSGCFWIAFINRRWYQVTCRLDDPAAQSTAPLPGLPAYAHALGFSRRDGRLVVMLPCEPWQTGVVRLADLARAGPSFISEHTMTLPTGPAVPSWKLSPDGERIAWYVRPDNRIAPGRGRIERLFTSLRARLEPFFPTTYRHVVYVSRRDGSDLREIGRVQCRLEDFGVGSLQWTPNGRRISFGYRDALWSVPAD